MRTVPAMCVLAVLMSVAVAQQVPDFSGTYVLKSHARSDSYSSASSNMMVGRVIRKVMRITTPLSWSEKGRLPAKYRLDGSEIQSAEPDGTPTVEHAEIKGKNPHHSIIHQGGEGCTQGCSD